MSTLKKAALLCGDLAILVSALAITLLARYGAQTFQESFLVHIGPFIPIIILWVFIFYLGDLYHPKTLRNQTVFLKTLVLAVVIAGSVSAIAFYLFSTFFKLTPKTNLAIFSALSFLFVYLWRKGALLLFSSGALPTIVFGSSPLIRKIVDYIRENPQTGFKIAAWTPEPDQKGLEQQVRESGARVVVFENKLAHSLPAFLQSIFKLLHLEITLMNHTAFFEMVFEKIPLKELNENWFVENIETRRPFYDTAKRIVDLLLGSVLFIILLPLSIVIAILIRLSSRGPILFTQKRVGKNGKEFTLYKFRTMRNGANDPAWKPWTEPNDSRITHAGRILRATHLDEIPQLWNIVKGNISFIGPRPERTELANQYGSLPYYDIRHTIKPGLTGWAQINFKPSASLEEAYEKLCYDIYYIKNRSLFLDILITLKTIRHLFSFNHS